MQKPWAFVAALLAAVMTLGLPSGASANPKYAAFVMHEGTGDVLFSRYADARRYPASLTKMMTLYVLFEDIEAGRIKLDDEIKVSAYAARQPASKLGLRSGSTIDVETAIEALVIKSANDVASAVAEHVSGSEAAFARRMTRTARDLGMRSTTFRNASGLPNRRQVTTARDMAKLAQRLRQDFPQHADFFAQKSFKWNKRTYRSHNGVMLTFDGATGLKTGYTRASGYNLATSAERNGQPLIGVVLGGRSGATRDRHMRDILSRGFRAIRANPSRIKVAYRRPPTPRMKPGTEVPVGTEVPSVVLASATSGADVLNLDTLAAAISSLEDGIPGIISQGDTDQEDPRDWTVQLGAYGQQTMAMKRLTAMEQHVTEVAPDADRLILPSKSRGRTLYRARFADVTAAEAEAVCEALKPKGEDCMALSPGR
ncbi:MAG: D-alanyl-D-alanine carboxypeptidase family protein [Pseudomonadota bacterium]